MYTPLTLPFKTVRDCEVELSDGCKIPLKDIMEAEVMAQVERLERKYGSAMRKRERIDRRLRRDALPFRF